MNKLIVTIPSLEGTYEFEDFSSFTNRELHRIKKMTGIRLGEFQEALEAGDNDLLVALSALILEREGKPVDDDVLWDAEAGALVFDFSEVANPTQGSTPSNVTSETGSTNSEPPVSGSDTETPSANPENGQSLTGHQDLPRSVISDPVTLEN